MSVEKQPWTHQNRPLRTEEFKGNQEALNVLRRWLKSWEKRTPKTKAAFLTGPPGTGKTSAVQLLADELCYDLLEVNASDYRTKKRLEDFIGRSTQQKISITGKKRMVLFDEMEGISGRSDRGGISTISRIIKDTKIPIILIATTIKEDMEDKFRKIVRSVKLIEFRPIPSSDICKKLEAIAQKKEVQVDSEVIESLAIKAKGDLRSAINDLEAVARGNKKIFLEDIKWLRERDRQEYIKDVLSRIFCAETVWEARKAIKSSFLKYDDLFDWIYENLPVVLEDPKDRLRGLEALSRADIYQNQARYTQNFRLLKYMFTEMTGGIAMSRTNSKGIGLLEQARKQILMLGHPQSDYEIKEIPEGICVKPTRYLGRDIWGKANNSFRNMGGNWEKRVGWVIPYYRAPQIKWHYIKTYHDRRKMQAVAEKLAEKCHIGTNEAKKEVIPLMKVMVNEDSEMSEDILKWLDLDEKEENWLLN